MQKQVDYIVKTLDEIKINNSEEHHAIIEHQKKTNGNVKVNTAFRLKNEELMLDLRCALKEFTLFKGGFNAIKLLLGFVGFSNLITIIYLFIK